MAIIATTAFRNLVCGAVAALSSCKLSLYQRKKGRFSPPVAPRYVTRSHLLGFFVELLRSAMERHADVLSHHFRRQPRNCFVNGGHVVDICSPRFAPRVHHLV